MELQWASTAAAVACVLQDGCAVASDDGACSVALPTKYKCKTAAVGFVLTDPGDDTVVDTATACVTQTGCAANVDAAKDSVNRQRSQEEELAAIKEDCEKVCATTVCATSEPFN